MHLVLNTENPSNTIGESINPMMSIMYAHLPFGGSLVWGSGNLSWQFQKNVIHQSIDKFPTNRSIDRRFPSQSSLIYRRVINLITINHQQYFYEQLQTQTEVLIVTNHCKPLRNTRILDVPKGDETPVAKENLDVLNLVSEDIAVMRSRKNVM